MNRLQTLAFAALGIVTLAAPVACSQNDDGSRSTRRAITQSQAIAADFLRTELALSPETASRLDLEDYLGPAAIFSLDNHSQAGFERRRLVRIELLQRLRQRPRLPADHALARDLAVAEDAILDLISLEQLGYGRFDYFDLRPYAVDPFSGVWTEGPNLLAYQQSINTIEQASAFITRLQALSAAVEDTKRRLVADRVAGLEMPRALADETYQRLQALIADDATALDLLGTTFAALTLDVPELRPDQRAQLVALVKTEIDGRLRPALQDLAATVAEMSESASDQAGIWAQPKGQDLFVGVLKASTGAPLSTDRLHARHTDDVASRVEALRTRLVAAAAPAEGEPAPVLPAPDLASLLVWYEELLVEPAPAETDPAEPELMEDTLRTLAPASIWATILDEPALGAQGDSISTYLNLWTTQPYLTWRTEGDGELPAHRQLTEYPAIDAAWRLYAWQNRASPPVSDLESVADGSIELVQLVLAAADTGLHLERWSLAEATTYIGDHTGLNPDLSRELALRIMARPGYHTAVVAAYHRFETLSERARAVLGERYSETDFQRTLIQPGPRPLSYIETDIEAWYGARLEN